MRAPDTLTLRSISLRPSQVLAEKNADLLLVFPKGGSGQYAGGLTALPLFPGDTLVVPGILGGELRAAEGAEFLFWTFTLRFENVFPLLASREIPLLENLAKDFQSWRHYPARSKVSKECHRLLGEAPPRFDLVHRGQLLRVAATVLSQEFNSVRAHRVGFVRIEEHLVQVFDKLSAQDILDMSVSELAAQFGCSRRHLNRLFHQHFGFAVSTLKMEMRLLRAIALLRDPRTKIIDVAEQCGFNHLGLFNICFKRRFGASPGQWRKALLSGAPSISEAVSGHNQCQLRSSGLCPWANRNQVHPPVALPNGKSLKGIATDKAGDAALGGELGDVGVEIHAVDALQFQDDMFALELGK